MDMITIEQVAHNLRQAICLSVDYEKLIARIEQEQNLPPPPNTCVLYKDGPKLHWDLMDDRLICFEAQRLKREKDNMTPADYEFNRWNIRRAACEVMKRKLSEVYELVHFFEDELQLMMNDASDDNDNYFESDSDDTSFESFDFDYEAEAGYYTDFDA